MFPARRIRRARESNQVVTDAPLDAGDGGASASRVRVTYVLLIPCRDCAAVIGDTLRALLALPSDRTHVLVIDEGSNDATAAVALTFPRARVTVIQRQLPHAQKGRRSALRAGLRMVRRMSLAAPDEVVIGVLGADDRLEPEALIELDRRFSDPGLLGTRLPVPAGDPHRSRRPRRDPDLRSVTGVRRVSLVWEALGPGRFVRLSALTHLERRP